MSIKVNDVVKSWSLRKGEKYVPVKVTRCDSVDLGTGEREFVEVIDEDKVEYTVWADTIISLERGSE